MATDHLSAVFSALADPTRREILARLARADATVGELAQPFSISLPAVSRHLKVLERAGLISQDKQAQWRTNSLRVESLQEATTWMDHLNRLWGDRFDRLDAHLAGVKRRLQEAAPQEAAPQEVAPQEVAPQAGPPQEDKDENDAEDPA